MTRARDTADTQDNLGGAVAPYVSGKNAIINGGFDIWQRGTSSSTDQVYLPDRWWMRSIGTNTNSQSTDVPSGVRVQYSLQGLTAAGSSFPQYHYSLEQADVIPLRSQLITVSWYMKVNATWSGSFGPSAFYNTTTDARASQTTSLGLTSNPTGSAPTTSWARYYATLTVPSNAVGLAFQFNPGVAQASGAQINFAAVQLELGNVPTPFARAGGSIGGELALCQRYYTKSYAQATAPATNTAAGALFSYGTVAANNDYVASRVFPVTMRTVPTVTVYGKAGTAAVVSNGGGTDLAASSGLATSVGEIGFNIYNASGGAITGSFGGFVYHYVASAEL